MANMNVTVIDQNNVKISIDRGLIGPQGISGFSGISGYSGYSGISGYSGSGISGYSGYSGQQGTSINVKGEVATVQDLPPTGNQVNDAYIVTADGNLWIWDGSAWFDAGQIVGPQGFSGFSGYSGWSGESGYSGFSGYSGSGVSGWSGDSGISGYSGWSGESGFSGISGWSGESGFSGISGWSGDSGISGWSGESGYSGFSGSGVSGWSGESGYSGYSGISGWSGEVGTSGFSGESGFSGFSGISGYSGSGVSGYSGYSGAVGTSGYSGISGYSGSGISGFSGFSGTSGYSGAIGQSSSLFLYDAEAVQTSGQPANGFLLWNTATQSNATQINISHLTNNGDDIDIFLALLQPTQKFTIQDQNVSGNYQSWLITGTPTNINPNTSNSYWTVPVSLISSGGTGTTDFADNHPLFLAITAGVSGTSGYSGYSGFSGISGWSGISGYSGASGISGQNGASGYSGISGISGYSGFSGISGQNGASGFSGYSGISGTNGASGFSGISGYSGYSGINGASGFSGYSGISGYSGSGISGYSGYSGISGYSGYSGITPTIGGSNTQVQYNNSGVLGGSSGLTWDGSFLTTSSIKNSALTSGRVTFAGASGLLSDSAGLTYNGTSLSVTYADNAFAEGLTITNSTNGANSQSKINITNSAGNSLALIQNGPLVNSGDAFISTSSTQALTFGINFAERLRLTNTSLYTASGVNVGIGTSSPVAKLDVYGGAANTSISVRTDSFDGTYYAGLDFSTGGQGANDPQAQIKAVGANNYSANLVFSTQQSGTTNPLVPRMTLLSGGNFGIGDTNPNQLLTLGSADGTQALSFVTSAYLGDNALIGNIEFSTHGADASYGNLANIKAYKTGTNTNSGDLTFWTKNNGLTDIRMRIKNDGAVGIGLNNPSTTLQVAGTVTATSYSSGLSGTTSALTPASSETILTVANYSMYLVYGGGTSNTSAMGMGIAQCNGGGGVTVTQLSGAATGFTLTSTGNNIQIQNNTATQSYRWKAVQLINLN